MANQHRIQSLSRLMVYCCGFAMIALPATIVWYWFTFSQHVPALQARWPNSLFALEYISKQQLLVAACVSLISASVLIFALWQLRQLFGLFSQGVVFSSETTKRLNLFGIALFVSAILSPITTGILSMVLSWGNPPGQRTLIFTLGSNEFALLLFASTFLIITWVFREGQRLSNENAEFV